MTNKPSVEQIMIPCPHIKLREQYLEDVKKYGREAWRRWEFNDGYGWKECGVEPKWFPEFPYRRKPTTIRVGDRDCPEPLREAPEEGTMYYLVDPATEIGYCALTWHGSPNERLWLADGLCHTTPEAAKAWAEAFKELARGKV